MLYHCSLLLCLFLSTALYVHAQTPSLAEWEYRLKPWAEQLVADTLSSGRVQASDSLWAGLQDALALPGAFSFPFDSLTSISFLTAPDNAFRLITWQLRINDSTWAYRGFVTVGGPNPVVYALNDRRMDLPNKPLVEELNPDMWYGALYYNIRVFDSPNGRRYLLFGYDGYALSERRKLLEVLWFDPQTAEPRFGDAVFAGLPEPDGKPVLRFILEYYAEGVVRLNWDEQYQLVLFDHLIPMASPYNGLPTYVADGSYSGFEWKNGLWHYVDNVFNDSQETVPRPFPVLDKEKGKDVFGRERKTRN